MLYKRVLLKLSGEQLQGQFEGGFDAALARWVAEEIKKATALGVEVVLMVGGGNYARGAQLASSGINRITGDNIGMLATIMNGLALSDIFNAVGLPARALTNIKADQVADQFTHRRALSHLHKGRVVIVAGGIARPFITTDTAAVSLALELDCDVILKTTKVDGVYDKDPAKFPDAEKFDTLTFAEALENPAIAVMDKAALGMAMEQNQPVIVFDLLGPGNIASAVNGDAVGTIIQ